LNLLPDPAPTFSDPIGLLSACHQRIRAHCDLLQRLPDWVGQHGVDATAHDAIERAMRYFDVAAPHHHADEEQDLFPLLRSDPDLNNQIARLVAEHRTLDDSWRDLRLRLDAIRAGAPLGDCGDYIDRFVAACLRHIGIEDTEILPIAEQVLDEDQKHRLGRAMARRRGVTTDAG
jgi:hemerythrin-like domain-containing protein